MKFVFVIDIENNDYPVGFDKIALNFDIRVFRKTIVYIAYRNIFFSIIFTCFIEYGIQGVLTQVLTTYQSSLFSVSKKDTFCIYLHVLLTITV